MASLVDTKLYYKVVIILTLEFYDSKAISKYDRAMFKIPENLDKIFAGFIYYLPYVLQGT